MTRALDSALSAHISQQQTMPIILIKAEFDSGDLNLWNGFGDLIFGDDTYTGAGHFMGFDSVRESSDIRANGTNISLSGVPSDILSIALSEMYQERPCTIFVGAIDTDGDIIAPYQLFTGLMDVMTLTDQINTATINLAVENKMADLERVSNLNYTPESQKVEFPDDTGFKWVAGLQDTVNFTWGVA